MAPLLASGSAVQSLYIEEDDTTMYDMQSESQLSYEQILAKKDPQETQARMLQRKIKTFLWTRQIPEIRQTGEMVIRQLRRHQYQRRLGKISYRWKN